MDFRRCIGAHLLRSVGLTLAFSLPLLTAAQDVSPTLLQAAYQGYQKQRSHSPVLVSAQSIPQSLASTSANWNNLSQLRTGDKLIVETASKVRHAGKFVAYSDESITLRSDKREVTFFRHEVFRVLLRTGTSLGKRVLIGACVGAGIGLAFGAALRAGELQGPGPGDGLLLTTLAFGGIGALGWGARGSRPHTLIYEAAP